MVIPFEKPQSRKWFLTMKHNMIFLLLMRVNCKKFLCAECGSDYISLSKNKHAANEKDIGRGESLSMGHPQENLTRSTVCASHGRAREMIPTWWSYF